jgi:3-hydroxy-3-methylglutaryl CoA synthase
MIGITAYGAYIPRRRLQRKSVAQANAWIAPNLVGGAKGERAMANWDEDAVTMAFEAGRDCLPATDPAKDRAHVDGIYFASTTFPYTDRQNAGIVAAALGLGEGISSVDFASSQRAGTSALISALDAVAAGRVNSALLVASDKRKTRAASAQELAYGDAAAAFILGRDNVVAKLLGSHTLTLDFVDHFRGRGEDFDYGWEERWIRDEGYSKIVPVAVKTILEKSKTAASEIAHFILPCPFARLDQTIAKQCGIDGGGVRDNLASNVGETGAGHALLMLVHALEEAKPGDKILVVQFANGADALLF